MLSFRRVLSRPVRFAWTSRFPWRSCRAATPPASIATSSCVTTQHLCPPTMSAQPAAVLLVAPRFEAGALSLPHFSDLHAHLRIGHLLTYPYICTFPVPACSCFNLHYHQLLPFTSADFLLFHSSALQYNLPLYGYQECLLNHYKFSFLL